MGVLFRSMRLRCFICHPEHDFFEDFFMWATRLTYLCASPETRKSSRRNVIPAGRRSLEELDRSETIEPTSVLMKPKRGNPYDGMSCECTAGPEAEQYGHKPPADRKAKSRRYAM